MYVSGYAEEGEPGIRLTEIVTGGLEVRQEFECPPDPTFLAFHPYRPVLYAIHELEDGLVSAFAVRNDGALQPIETCSSGGSLPIHVSVHPGGRHLLLANWGDGSVVVRRLEEDGALSSVTDVVPQQKAAAHMAVTDRSGRWVLVVHFGAGSVFTFELDPDTGRLLLRDQARVHEDGNAGPRHLAFHPDGTGAYVVNEHESSLTACRLDPATGQLEQGVTVSTVPEGVAADENHPSAVLVTPDGRFVLVANRGHDSIGVFTTTPSLRLLANFPCGGDFPRDMAFGHEGSLYVANERGNSISTMTFDPKAGSLTLEPTSLGVPRPTCVLPWPTAG